MHGGHTISPPAADSTDTPNLRSRDGGNIKKHENTPQNVVTPGNIGVSEHFRKLKSFLFNHSKTVVETKLV